tara:strand:+ start:2935 stop:3312 length:378 start_codon:yes stop_codon:yes gene_type:complete
MSDTSPRRFANPFTDTLDFGGPLTKAFNLEGSPFGDLFASRAPYADAWKAMMIDVPMTMTAEMMRFAGRRFVAQAELCDKLAKCDSFADAIDAQSEFVEEAIGDFNAETAKLAQESQAVVKRETA